MDWIHCNDCYKQPYSSPNTSFVLTACARIQCSECNTSNSCVNKDCKPCRSQNYSVVAVPLDDSLPSIVEEFFCDPLDHLKRFVKVNDFQRNHREQLLKHQAEEQKQMTIQASQLMNTNTELENQLQKYRSETNNVKEENLVLRSKIQELQSCLEKERRPLATKLYQHGTSSDSSEPKGRKCPSPTIDGAPGIRTTIPWQAKFPDPPNRVGVPTCLQRFIPTTPKQQPYRTRLTQQFLNLETPAYFSSNSSSTQCVRSNNIVTPRIPAAAFPTPIHRPHHVMAAPANQLGIHSIQQQLCQQQKRNHTTQVYPFMSEAARQAFYFGSS